MVALRRFRRAQRQPRVAAKAAVPPDPAHLPDEDRVLLANLARVGPFERVTGGSARQQLPVEARDEGPRSLAYAGEVSGRVGHGDHSTGSLLALRALSARRTMRLVAARGSF